MSAVIDDDKHHINYKVSTNNLRLECHIRDNRLGRMNHDVALTGANLIFWNECEKPSDATTIDLKRLIYKLFSP